MTEFYSQIGAMANYVHWQYWCHNKRIAITGPRPNFETRKADEFDLIVSVNFYHCHMAHRNPKVIFFAGDAELVPDPYAVIPLYMSLLFCNLADMSLVKHLTPVIPVIMTPQETDDPTLLMDFPWLRSLGFFPLTGFVAMHKVQQTACKEIFLTGMDLYSNPKLYNVEEWRGGHNISKHKQYLKQQLEWDPRLTADKALLEGLDQPT